MDKEYFTKDNYDKLKLELEELEGRKVELKEAYDTASEEYEETERRICELNSEIKQVDKKKETYLENGTDGVDFLTISIGSTLTVVNGIGSLFIGGATQNLFWMLNAFFSTPAIFYGIVCFLRKKLKIRKKEKLRASFEYQNVLGELRKIEKERDNNYSKKNNLSATCQRSLSDLESIRSDIALKKQEISEFEREVLNLYLNQEVEEKYKTRVLEP